MKPPAFAGPARRTFPLASALGLLLVGLLAAAAPSVQADWTCVGNTAETILPGGAPQINALDAEVCTDPLNPPAASACARVGNTGEECFYIGEIQDPRCNWELQPICVQIADVVTVVGVTIGAPTVFTVVPGAGPAFASAPVQGYVDRYAFFSGSVVVPCLVLTIDDPYNPCATAGGAFLERESTIVDTSKSLPTGGIVATGIPVNTCEARLYATVDGLGVNGFPFATVC